MIKNATTGQTGSYMKIRKESILKFFREGAAGPVEFRELMRLFGLKKAERSRFKDMLDDLAAEGRVRKLKGNLYEQAMDSSVVVGKLSTHRDGYGFVTPDAGGEDIFIPARYLRESIHGDRVEVNVIAARSRDGKNEGCIVRTLERALTRIVGRFERKGNSGYIIPDEQRIARYFTIPPGASGKAEHGQVVVAEITAYPTSHRPAEGKIIEVLGWPDDPDVEVRTIIRKYDLPHSFSPRVLADARTFSQTVLAADREGRVDLRDNLTVTIDGETARDFDDAVSVRREEGGFFRLWVSIADVSHYVKPGSPIDSEASLRGTSVYFPDRCIPMLPEELSNGICSLNPDVERLALTAEILFDKEATPLHSSFYPSIIRSSARLTYTAVARILVEKDAETTQTYSHLAADLTVMEDLAKRLMEKRRKRGSIDFDLPEPQIILDLQGQTTAIVRAERTLAHRIIEEFMLAANEAVASFIEGHDVPSIYRIHEPPDPVKLVDFGEFIHNFGYEFQLTGDRAEPGEFQRLLDEALGKPEERMINEVLLRSMKQARYSAENLGHFGLAAPCYTHFTSPIRRYPDLVVHRILKSILAGRLSEKKFDQLGTTLPDVALHASSRERLAMEAERDIVLLKKIQFMRDRVGEEFDSFITGVTPHGLFVELTALFVEGMIHVSTLPPDFYRFVEKQHALVGERSVRTFRIGDKVRVRVAQVSIERKQIDFVLAEIVPYEHADSRLAVEKYPKLPVKGKRPKPGPRTGGRQKRGGRPGKRR